MSPLEVFAMQGTKSQDAMAPTAFIKKNNKIIGGFNAFIDRTAGKVTGKGRAGTTCSKH